jgi:hypothetical protein
MKKMTMLFLGLLVLAGNAEAQTASQAQPAKIDGFRWQLTLT